MTNRRDFLATLAAAATGSLLDPERLVWVPGKVAHFDIVRPPSLVPDDWTESVSGLLTRGDIITLKGYYEPNQPGRQTTKLQEFVIIDSSNMDHLVKIAPAGSIVGPAWMRAPKNYPVTRVWAPPVKGRRR